MIVSRSSRLHNGLRQRGATGLWSIDLDGVDRAVSLLSRDEIERAERFRTTLLRDRYVAGRCWMRRVLANEIGTAPEALRFRYLEFGKPVLDHPSEARAFSLAHAGRFAVLGVGPSGPLGVDIERVVGGVYDPSVAAAVLSPSEVRFIEFADDRDRAFLRCWVRKEAYAKVGGRGMDRHLAAITLTGPDKTVPTPGVTISEVEAGVDLMVAVAHPTDCSVVDHGLWSEGATA